jgi:hypothetical protein
MRGVACIGPERASLFTWTYTYCASECAPTLSEGSTSLYEWSRPGSVACAAVDALETFRGSESGRALAEGRAERSERARDASDFCRRRELERGHGLARIDERDSACEEGMRGCPIGGAGECARRACCIAAISSPVKPASASEVDHDGGIPCRLWKFNGISYV